MVYLLKATNEYGDPVELAVEFCWRCGGPVYLGVVSMSEHVDRCHPARAGDASGGDSRPAQHRLGEPPP